jgi:hypothetical protein
MGFNLTHSQVILRYKENGGWIEPYYSNQDCSCTEWLAPRVGSRCLYNKVRFQWGFLCFKKARENLCTESVQFWHHVKYWQRYHPIEWALVVPWITRENILLMFLVNRWRCSCSHMLPTSKRDAALLTSFNKYGRQTVLPSSGQDMN